MRIEKAKEITGSLSKPSKMPGHAYGLPAKECKTGGKLQKVKGSTCYGSGDVQDLKHLAKIFEVARRSPSVAHWLPTREAWTVKYQDRAPANLKLIFSMPMVNQEAAGKFNYTSTVVTDPKKATCPAPQQGNECKSCRACWDKKVKNVAYLAH
jgi:hypothetical protein